MRIQIPNKYTPRCYQVPVYNCLANGYRRGVAVWHRRAGKDLTYLAITVKEAAKRVGTYFYFYPEFKQARKAIWDGKDKDGVPFMDRVPKEAIRRRLEDDMKVELVNGSIIQFVGTDNIDSIMSSNPVGNVFAEYSLQKPEAWDFVRPIIRENGGWALFNYTPRGHNHGYNLFQMAMKNPAWHCELKAACVHPKFNPDGEIPYTGALTAADIDAELADGMSESLVRQEYFCDFDVTADEILIPLQLVMSAVGRNVSYAMLPKVMGVDVGMSLGGDPSAIVGRQGPKFIEIEEKNYDDTIQIAGWVRERFLEGQYQRGYIDSIGWGAGVAHTLMGWGIPFTPVNVAETASDSEKFNRLRDQLWWQGAEFFAAKQCGIDGTLPLANKLITELSTPTYKILPSGKIKVEGKDDLIKRGIKSPNLADACLLTLKDGVVSYQSPGTYQGNITLNQNDYTQPSMVL